MQFVLEVEQRDSPKQTTEIFRSLSDETLAAHVLCNSDNRNGYSAKRKKDAFKDAPLIQVLPYERGWIS